MTEPSAGVESDGLPEPQGDHGERATAATIQATVVPQVTFASHQCNISVIRDLTISNTSSQPLTDLRLHLSCDPPILGERVWAIDHIGPEAEHWVRDRDVTLKGALLHDLRERMNATARFELRSGEEILAVAEHPITALAMNEWGGSRFMPELLAAFVTPNDPAVGHILRDTSRILSQNGRSGSIEGYLSKSRKRIWEIVSGIWAAVVQRNLTYAAPPASFESNGQKIRLPSMILDQRLATCLDTALLFAAAIEQAGLHPMIVLLEGHAFCGAWLQPQDLATLTTDDPMEIRKAVDLQELILFECTQATADTPIPFMKAIQSARDQISESNEGAFVYALDVHRARGQQVQPLSTRGSTSEGHRVTAVETPTLPALDQPPELPKFDVEPEEKTEDLTPTERLDRWKRSLLDLTKRNRLLNLRESDTAIPLICPDLPELEDRIAGGKKIRIIPPPERHGQPGETDPDLFHLRTGSEYVQSVALQALERNELIARHTSERLEKGIVGLYRKAKADLEEGGANTLFLAIGMLRWKERSDSDRSFRAPMILLPVTLVRKSAASKPCLTSHDDDAVFNLTLLEMLRQDFAVTIPALEGDLPTDESGIDVRKILEIVRHCVREVPGFEVVEETVLSTFSFAKYLMWKDLSDRTDQLKESPFVQHLIDTPREPYQNGGAFIAPDETDDHIAPGELLAPLNADSSQILAIHASGEGGDFVLEGPPGTGKSETIGNIIAHNLGLGRKVLFVSEKMAALEVVYRRLQSAGLSDFCLELHSAKANKKSVIHQLGQAWDKRSAHSQDEWEESARDLREVRDRLNRVVRALHTPGPGGVSPRAAIGRTVRYGDVHPLQLGWGRDEQARGQAPTPEALRNLESIAEELALRHGELADGDLKAFAELKSEHWSYDWQSRIVDQARSLAQRCNELHQTATSLRDQLGLEETPDDPEELQCLEVIANLLPRLAGAPPVYALDADAGSIFDVLEGALEKVERYHECKAQLTASYADEAILTVPLTSWQSRREEAKEKVWPLRPLALRRLRRDMRRHFGVSKRQIREPEFELGTLGFLQELHREFDRRAAGLPRTCGWRGLATDIARQRERLELARELRSAVLRYSHRSVNSDETRESLTHRLCSDSESLQTDSPLPRAGSRFTEALRGFEDERRSFEQLGEGSVAAIGLERLEVILTELVDRQARLRYWCRWVEIRRTARAHGLDAVVEALERGAIAGSESRDSLRTAYCRWLAPILIDTRPELRSFSTASHQNQIDVFRRLDRQLAEASAREIRARLSGEVPNRSTTTNKDPRYGVLSRELQKKTRHRPVRTLVGEMGDALLDLTPCLLMSPLSVAQYLPTDQSLFDLVVFDEASQITVPDAIGAIARARSCIIVGDPKQMPPTRFFGREADLGEDDDDRDLESVLDEAMAARVPHHRLTGHYRSRHESLICFSNHAYYENSLVTFPSADTRETAVSFRRVDGVYSKGKNRTNPIEARAIVDEIAKRLKDPRLSRLSIGVVTLNSEQQRLVEDLLDELRRREPDLEPFFDPSATEEPIFVKNLETVQGDQRDVILLSIGYGPTEPGARTMSMNFGPLNRSGGERRLNVAITRATTEVLLFASFDSSMIDLTRTSARAVQDLKHYMDYADRGTVALGEAVQSIGGEAAYDSDFEAAVADRLRSLGWTVHTQIGVSKFRIDLGIVHPDEPGRYMAGIECDGATYHSSPTARDRDRVRHLVLENLGWRLLRIWSTDFFHDPVAKLRDVDTQLRSLLEEDRRSAEGNTVTHDAGSNKELGP